MLQKDDVVTVKLTLPNNTDNSPSPNFCNPRIFDSGFSQVSFTNWLQTFFPLTGEEVVWTSEPATATDNYFLNLNSENYLLMMRVVLVEVTKTGSSEPILKVADLARTRHQILLYLDKETEVTFSVDKATTTSIQLLSLDERLIINGLLLRRSISSATPQLLTVPKGFSVIRFFLSIA